MKKKLINRVIYKMVGLHESGRPQLVYVGQTTDFNRRVLQHKDELHQAVVNVRRRRQRSYRTKYDKLQQHFRAGRVVFEKLAEGPWTWEEAVLRETETILEFRKAGGITVLNALDNPRSGSMPEGRVAKLADGRVALSAIAGLKPGFEAVLIDGKSREIVRVHTKVSGPFRGIEVWTFVRTGDKWTDGNMPWAIGLRVYRGPMLTIFKKTARELAPDRSKQDEHASVLKPLGISSAAPEPGTGEITPEQIRAIGKPKTKKVLNKSPSPTLARAAASAAAALGGKREKRPWVRDAPPKFRGVLESVTGWELRLIRAAVGASRGNMNALNDLRRIVCDIATGATKIDRASRARPRNAPAQNQPPSKPDRLSLWSTDPRAFESRAARFQPSDRGQG